MGTTVKLFMFDSTFTEILLFRSLEETIKSLFYPDITMTLQAAFFFAYLQGQP